MSLAERFAGPEASLLDLRLVVFAVLSTVGMLRSSETLHLKLSDVVDLGSHLQVTIARSKCSDLPQQVTMAANNTSCCPVTLMRRYTRSLRSVAPSQTNFLFPRLAFQSTLNRHVPLPHPVSYTRMLELVKSAFKDLGFRPQDVGLHSFRRGGATAAANADVNERLLQKHGRWKTSNIKNQYIDEDLDHLLSVSRAILT